MSFVSWFKSRKETAVHHSTKAKRPFRYRPQVEILEDRLAPAIFTVTTPQDLDTTVQGHSLRSAILQADLNSGSNTINVPAGTYYLNLKGTSHDGTDGALQIRNNDLTINAINGAGTVIIDGSQLNDRIFDIEGGVSRVAFNGLVIQKGHADSNSNVSKNGGGIYDFGGALLTLNNTFVLNNVADSDGGGLYQTGGNLSISGGAISGNSTNAGFAIGYGGGIDYAKNGGTVARSQTRVSNNSGNAGGGLYMIGSTLNMTQDFITNNSATNYGGGMYARFSSAIILDCNFSNNNGGNSYGGLYLQTSATSDFYDNIVGNNQASNSGSGLYWLVTGGSSIASGIIVSGNSGPNGTPGGSGASLQVNGASTALSIADSTFAYNKARQGGAIYVTTASSGDHLYLDSDTIYGNFAQDSGGGLYASGTAGGTYLYNVTISGNNARTTGGVYNGATNLWAENTIIADNSDSAGNPDVHGTFQDLSHNLIGAFNGSSGFFYSTLVGSVGSSYQHAGLGPLQDNGSDYIRRPFTMNLLPGSPAIGAGVKINSTDERGFARPGQGESRIFHRRLRILASHLHRQLPAG